MLVRAFRILVGDHCLELMLSRVDCVCNSRFSVKYNKNYSELGELRIIVAQSLCFELKTADTILPISMNIIECSASRNFRILDSGVFVCWLMFRLIRLGPWQVSSNTLKP